MNELYHPGYVAKRMEIGAVVGATPADHVRREEPSDGDVVVLLGGRTGRDGIGGATGSSKSQGTESLEECGAEVQKGNAARGAQAPAPVPPQATHAGSSSAATTSVPAAFRWRWASWPTACSSHLDRVPKKYEGLDGTELAISESQERMAVALDAADVEEFIGYAHEENLEATPIAEVTGDHRVRMEWGGDVIVDLSRDFLASNGAPKHARVHVKRGGSYDTGAEVAGRHAFRAHARTGERHQRRLEQGPGGAL